MYIYVYAYACMSVCRPSVRPSVRLHVSAYIHTPRERERERERETDRQTERERERARAGAREGQGGREKDDSSNLTPPTSWANGLSNTPRRERKTQLDKEMRRQTAQDVDHGSCSRSKAVRSTLAGFTWRKPHSTRRLRWTDECPTRAVLTQNLCREMCNLAFSVVGLSAYVRDKCVC